MKEGKKEKKERMKERKQNNCKEKIIKETKIYSWDKKERK